MSSGRTMEIWEKAEETPSLKSVRNHPEKPVGVEKAFFRSSSGATCTL